MDSQSTARDRPARTTINHRSKTNAVVIVILTLARACHSFLPRMLRGILLLATSYLATHGAHAQSATWLLSPPSGDFDTALNWSPPTVPGGTGTATFGLSNTTTITFSFSTDIGALQFNAGAPAYSFDISSSVLSIHGAGIVNSSSNRPTFDNAPSGTPSLGDSGTLFLGTSTAGNAIIINHAGSGGFTVFANSSTAGNATVITTGFGTSAATFFDDTSSAGNATVIATSGGFTEFNNSSTAASATVITDSGGFTAFQNTPSGGNARFITNAGGIFDISLITSSRITVGSIEGAGTYSLGSKVLIVGSNNLSTEVSGTIADNSEFSSGTGGALIKVGTGTLTLSGANTYTGGTMITGGTLQIGDGGTTGSIVGNVLDNSNLAFSRSDAITFPGIVSGKGTMTQIGPGTLILTGANSYSGGTIITSGTLSIDEDAELGNPGGGITLAGGELLTTQDGFSSERPITLNPSRSANTLAALTGTTATYAGVFSGDGALVVGDSTHAGTVVLAGNNTYSGGTLIELGTLVVDDAQAFGTGNVTVSGGILTADPQPINVKGNYTQFAGGTLRLQVAGAAPGQYDTLNVGGNASLGGTLQLISLGFQPKAGNLLTLVTTGGMVSGRFARFVDPFATGPGFTIAGLVYEPDAVLLEFRTAASFALTPNQLASASLLDAVHMDPRAANLISFLDQEPFANLPGDLEKISPDGLTAFYEISFSNANTQKLTLESRLDDLHSGSNGFSSNMKVNGATVNDKVGPDGKSSKAVVEPVLQHAPENRWGVWVTGFGDFVDVDGDGNAQGYNFTTGGVSVGLDYRITDQLAIGAFSEYSHTWTDLNPGGHIDVDSGRGGVYATWFNHGIYINGAIYGGHNDYDSGRAGLGGLANGSTEGSEWSTFIGGGYDFHCGQLTGGPIASLQYTDVGVDSFSEKGSLAPLDIHSGSAESLRSDVGFRAFYQWQIGKMVVEPSLKAAWEHEYKYSALPVTAGFAGIPGPSATFFGPSEGHDSAVVSAGVSVQVTPAISTYVNYDGQLGRGNYDSNGVTGGVRISF